MIALSGLVRKASEVECTLASLEEGQGQGEGKGRGSILAPGVCVVAHATVASSSEAAKAEALLRSKSYVAAFELEVGSSSKDSFPRP